MEKIGITITVLSIIISLIILIRDLKREKKVSQIRNSIKKHWIKIILIGSFFLGMGIYIGYHYFKNQRGIISYYDLTKSKDKIKFYDLIEQSYHNAKDEILITGRGFKKDTDETRKNLNKLSRATEDAINKGVIIKRIQITDEVSKDWCITYSNLIQKNPKSFNVFLDLKHNDLINIALIDAYGDNPIIELLFEVKKQSQDNIEYKVTSGIIISGNSTLAQNLHKQLSHRIATLKPISHEELNNLGNKHFE